MLLCEIQIAGNAGHDASDKVTQNGQRLVKFSIAVQEKDNLTSWYNVTAFGGEGKNWLADDAARVKKGDHVFVRGRLSQRSYQGRDGQQKTSCEIVAAQVGILQRPATTAARAGAPAAAPWEAHAPADDRGSVGPAATGGLDDIPF